MVPQPAFRLWYRGVDIASEIMPHLIACIYTDKLEDASDEIDVRVQDKDGLWRGPWCPDESDKLDLEIAANVTGPYVPSGTFELDDPNGNVGRKGDDFSFRGQAAPISKALRTEKTKAFEKQSLAQIAGKIASDHGLTIVGKPPNITFDRITQRRERDLQFLSRLASNYGCYFSVRGGQLIFMPRDEVHARAPVRIIDVDDPGLITASFKKGAHKTYSKAKASYFDGKQKKNITVEIEDKSVKTGDTLKIDDRVENEGQARLRAKSGLQKENLKKKTMTMIMVGDPYLVAGQTIMAGPGFGKWAGKYVVQESRHELTRKGYITSLEIACVD